MVLVCGTSNEGGGVRVVEGAFSIYINPCTLPACIAACKNVLKDKFKSASCASSPPATGKFCLCL
ncbi:unnamed protein product [Linum tenue]|uniref:Uncharacterized protein n=1 Tax=Linum tenue TaxID=586396 RepID=A0AAV0HIF5_9ROSI|nr:unnamed protein product [Linum tenue]